MCCIMGWRLCVLNVHNDEALASDAGLLLFLLNCFAHVDLKHINVSCFSLFAFLLVFGFTT